MTGGGDTALAAALVAVKLEIPTAWLAPEEADEGKLISLVAFLAIAGLWFWTVVRRRRPRGG